MTDAQHWPREPRLAYRISEVAECAGISRGMIYKLIAAGKLKTIKIGRCTVVPAGALRSLMENGSSLS